MAVDGEAVADSAVEALAEGAGVDSGEEDSAEAGPVAGGRGFNVTD